MLHDALADVSRLRLWLDASKEQIKDAAIKEQSDWGRHGDE